ncbi:MAG TPA: hypothetical protein PLH79_18910, partial [bacterium]|nr:hypothetical protein [bacterium]
MLDSLDLSQQLPKGKYKEYLAPLKNELRDLQREVINARRPVIILFEGLEASGKGDSIRKVVEPLDPRGFNVELTPLELTPEDALRPPLRRFWLRIPAQGEIGIFDRSWYGRVLVERVEGFCAEADWLRAYAEINDFEHQLSDAGAVV